MSDLAQKLIDVGLIQFGWFGIDRKHPFAVQTPFALHLEMLPSYPDVLEQAAREVVAAVDGMNFTRLLCTFDSLPLGVVVSQISRIPLVYSRGSDEAAVFDLVGGYDIGHSTLMLTNVLGLEQPLTTMLRDVALIGLGVTTIVPILEVRNQPQAAGVKVLPLLRFSNVVRDLAANDQLKLGHAQAVFNWLKS